MSPWEPRDAPNPPRFPIPPGWESCVLHPPDSPSSLRSRRDFFQENSFPTLRKLQEAGTQPRIHLDRDEEWIFLLEFSLWNRWEEVFPSGNAWIYFTFNYFHFLGEYSNPNLGSCLRSRTLIPSSAPASSREKFQPGLEDVGNGEASPSPGGFFGSFDHSGIKKMGIFLLLFCIRLWLPASPGDRESIPGFSRAAEPALPILHPRKIPFFPRAGTRG